MRLIGSPLGNAAVQAVDDRLEPPRLLQDDGGDPRPGSAGVSGADERQPDRRKALPTRTVVDRAEDGPDRLVVDVDAAAGGVVAVRPLGDAVDDDVAAAIHELREAEPQAAGAVLGLVGFARGRIRGLDLLGDAFSEPAGGVAAVDDVALPRLEKAAPADFDPAAGRPAQDGRRAGRDGARDRRAGAFAWRRFDG